MKEPNFVICSTCRRITNRYIVKEIILDNKVYIKYICILCRDNKHEN